MNKLITLILPFLLFSHQLLGQEKTFTIPQLKNDLTYLQKQLERKHPNLYTYNSPSTIQHVFDSLSLNINQPLTELEFYKHITILSSVINDGHTIILPSSSITLYHNKKSKFLPYHFTILNGQLYIDMVCTNDSSIPNGSEILSINNLKAIDIIEQLTTRQIRDGYNTTYPLWILNNYFREYYSYVFGHPDQFEIEFKKNMQEKKVIIQGLQKDSIYYYQDLKYPNNKPASIINTGIVLQVFKETNFAVLTIKDFHNSVLRKEYHQNFTQEMHHIFDEIQQSGVQHLILDLRNNQGGDIPNGALLVSYLLNKPFSIVEAYHVVGKAGLKKSGGQSLGIFNPMKNVFQGELYVLINGGSFSNSGVVSSCLKRNNRGIFIGEETGGNNQILAGYGTDIALPNTKIRVQIPTRQFLLNSNLPLTGHGTSPDHYLQKSLDDIINNTDNIMNYTIQLINKN